MHPTPFNLARTLTHTELPIELVGEQRVWQLSEVEFAKGGHTVDILQESRARQFRNPLAVEFMPEIARSGGRKFRSDGPTRSCSTTSSPTTKCPNRGNPLPRPWAGLSKEGTLTNPQQPAWQRQECPISKEEIEALVGDAFACSTQGCLTMECNPTPT